VSDQGLVHRTNDDAFYLEAFGSDVVAVVCDGVSTSSSADLAARRAARAAGVLLAEALRDDRRDPAAAVGAAMAAAHQAVEQLAPVNRADRADPACTLVSAIYRNDELTVGWLGDSRAYWLSSEEELQLTSDNSWAAEQVAAGALSAEAAAADPRAHSITRWVGTDAPEAPPQIVTFRPAEPGLLVLCSDGLWNYAQRPSDLARIVRQLPAAASPLAISRWLADSALKAGGHDNITVAVVDVRLDGRRAP
jgi:serine/threonine protein phosphatase PrpC